ncbi:hypothetical protein [Litorisediminicola beolgyonensis]|uniref:Uncharacterized protein n=1 Tax=Litorisediminicola beolgyonensis TaxID=1173614 RepID=A0ABW3ZN16_9RHOB
MHFQRRSFLASAGALALCGSPLPAATDYSLSRQARWRSFGEDKAWAQADPFERARPGAVRLPYDRWSIRPARGRTGQLLDLIAFAEAGKHQYDAIHMSARNRPRARPTELTLQEIMRWIRATPGQHHAIGRYQFIPSTLATLTRRAQLGPDTRFHPGVQDKLASYLLNDAGYAQFLAGRIGIDRFMDNLAKIWAGLPTRTGRSHYHGYAGNRATISRGFFSGEMRKIFAA